MRRAEDVISGPRGRVAWPATGDGRRVLVVAPRHAAPVCVAGGHVVQRGTAPELQRLVGLTEAALRAYAAGRGWRLEDHDA